MLAGNTSAPWLAFCDLSQIEFPHCHAVLTDLGPGREPQLILEPGAFRIFCRIAALGSGLVSGLIPTDAFFGSWPFQD